MKWFILCCLSVGLCTCGRAPEPARVTRLTGTLRYQMAGQLLEADLRLSPADTLPQGPAPTLFGTAVDRSTRLGPGSFRSRRQLVLPPVIRLTAPCASGSCPVTIPFAPAHLDSLPPVIVKDRPLAVPFAAEGLASSESVVLFLEPDDRSTPRRLQLVGPTDSGTMTLPPEALADIPPGDYQAYLIKQRLAKDSSAVLVYRLQAEYFTRSRPVRVTAAE